MKSYKLKLLHSQIVSLFNSLNVMFQAQYTLENIEHETYYNIKLFLKRVHDKIFRMNDMIIDKKYHYNITIDLNEAKSFKEIFALNQESIEANPYINILFIEVISQIEKQEIELMDRHKYMNPPISIVNLKLSNDNLKKLD